MNAMMQPPATAPVGRVALCPLCRRAIYAPAGVDVAVCPTCGALIPLRTSSPRTVPTTRGKGVPDGDA